MECSAARRAAMTEEQREQERESNRDPARVCRAATRNP